MGESRRLASRILRRRLAASFFLLLWGALAPEVLAKGQYLTQAEFLAEVFGQQESSRATLWLNDELQVEAKRILGHRYASLRLRYWRGGSTTAWILDEIGKTRPITIGVSVNESGIERVRIMEFRESRGGEVRMPFFTDQFPGLSLVAGGARLNRSIDGISGATMSVSAVKKVAAFALHLHSRVSAGSDTH